MSNLTKTIVIGLAGALLAAQPLSQTASSSPNQQQTTPERSDTAMLNELSNLATKHLRVAALAESQGSASLKPKAARLRTILGNFNEELRNLAKSKSIVLVTALPEGGQRPDGRIDASPENLRDTSRIKTGAGEAGKNGTVKTKSSANNDASTNALISSLKKLRGSAFDQAYRNLLAGDRETAQALLTKTVASKDTQVTSFAKKYLYMLENAKI